MTDEIATALARMEAKIDQLARGGRAGEPPRLLSKRLAARLLGIDRDETLAKLLASGNLRTVTVAGRIFIPLAEVDRLEREGTTRTGQKPHRKIGAASGGDEAAKIRALVKRTS